MLEKRSLILSQCAAICSAGRTNTLLSSLTADSKPALQWSDSWLKDKSGYFGIIDLPDTEPGSLSKSNLLLKLLLDEIMPEIRVFKSGYDNKRVAVVIATTTTGMQNVENAKTVRDIDYHNDQELSACSSFVAQYCGIDGPVLSVSTACTSGAKVFGVARKLIEGGWCDAAIVGASESLCKMTCQGFDALESYSNGRSRPFQKKRDGINIGEGAAVFLIEKGTKGIALSGYGESSDAYHESAPDPSGAGAESAIRRALIDADLSEEEIDYINLHGTGTLLNDAMESNVIHRVFGNLVKVSTTKSIMGHTLGAAGAIEAAIIWLLLNETGPTCLPYQIFEGEYDPTLPKLDFVSKNTNEKVVLDKALSTSFAFGGHNTALILERIGVR